ncbi:MAG TPA: hypothetical protein VL588_08895 [Bdellovibrionota bacterium]|nr:hypothetical protein [Bdellovibrionota bacterium]
MNKRLITVILFGAFLSPNVLADTVLYESNGSATRQTAGITRLGEMSLDQHHGTDSQCIFDRNPHSSPVASSDSGRGSALGGR